MKLYKNLFLILLLTSFASCSLFQSDDSSEEVATDEEIEKEVVASEDADTQKDDGIEEELISDNETSVVEESLELEDEQVNPVASNAPMEEAQAVENQVVEEINTYQDTEPVILTGNVGSYTVKENETLMLISFKVYGDYLKWRKIANLNQDKIGSDFKVSKGTILKFNSPDKSFDWQPKGVPYLIKTGDTLGVISNYAYNTARRWKSIWDNNRPMIKDPNLIFAGFTLYYVPDETASK